MNKEIRYIKIIYTAFIVGLTLLFGVSFLWNLQKAKQATLAFAKIEGMTNFEKDVLYRRWASMHGGVYVPVTPETPPNPYLENIPNRDVTTDSGRTLTLVNPVYMTRQVHEIAKNHKGVQGHITSLLPIREKNKADDWEKQALLAFEAGITEYSGIQTFRNQEYLRYMKPLKTEKACLKCHGQQGYKEGDIRGGISVSIPMDKYNEVANEQIKDLALNHSVIYLIILLLGSLSYKNFLNGLHNRNIMHQKIVDSENKLQAQNAEYARLNNDYIKQNRELQAAKERAEESDHMKSAFIQNMSHEIRTPLNAVMGFANMLGEDNLSKEKQQQFTGIIQNSSSQLLAIVNDILTISALESKKEKLNNEKVQLNQLLNELHSIFNNKINKNKLSLSISNGLDDASSEIYTDKTKLTQILTNLLSNAIKFTEEGFVNLGYVYKNQCIEFFVKDSGIGIEKHLQEEVFGRFKQGDSSTSKKYGGTGLGLAISKALTELLGGKIWLDSFPGKGTTFYFTIPYKPVDQHITNKAHEPNLNAPITLLVAEDDPHNFMLIQELLKKTQVRIIHAKNGIEAVEACKNSKDISVVLMDINMPEMNGIAALSIIKEIKADLPVIAYTAYANPREKSRILKHGFDDYLEKPFKKEKLLQLLMQHSLIKTTVS